MKRLLFLALGLAFMSSCSDDVEPDRLMYDITYTVETSGGATINTIEYRDDKGDLVEVSNATSPWTINLRVRAGLALEAAAYGDVPHEGLLRITAEWTPEGGSTQSESETLTNDTPNSTIDNGKVEIPGRTLPD